MNGKVKNILVTATIIAVTLIGATQYPNTQTLQKKETFPPKNFALRVTTNPPIHIIKNIIPKMLSLSLVDEKLMVNAKIKHKTSGPHKSPIKN